MGILHPNKLRVAVLRGGPSPEYDISLKTGANVLSILRDMPESYDPVDVFISKEGEWHNAGVVREPKEILRNTDVVWNAMHGTYGEDGQVQKILDRLMIPYTGSDHLSSALAFNKHMAKKAYEYNGLLTPRYEIVDVDTFDDDQLIFIFQNFMHPLVIKPTGAGSSLGVTVVHTFAELANGLKNAFEYSKKVLIEEFIRGKEATCGVVEDMRGERFYALLPIEIIKEDKKLFDFDSKYSSETQEVCPGNFSTAEKKAIEQMAKKAHEALALSHYSRSDFIVTPKSKVYILETNSLPGFTTESLLPKSLEPLGLKPADFVNHVIKLALQD